MIWPALLIALQRRPGYEWVALPRQVYAHSFWVSDGRKMGKSLGNFVDLERLARCQELVGLDGLRYFLANEGPLDIADRDFTEARIVGGLQRRARQPVRQPGAARHVAGGALRRGIVPRRARMLPTSACAPKPKRCLSASGPPSIGWPWTDAAGAILDL